VRFLAIGDGAERECILSEARRLGVLDENLFVWASRAKLELAPIVAAADLMTSFVLPVPALWDNSANKFFDGLAAGTPVGINYGGWQADIIERSGAGIVLDWNSIEKAAEDLCAFVTDPDRVAQARLKAQQLAEKDFDRDFLARRLEAFLIAATSQGRAGRTG
jgi:glycosyltransferase involved in cell wall biosynthesis